MKINLHLEKQNYKHTFQWILLCNGIKYIRIIDIIYFVILLWIWQVMWLEKKLIILMYDMPPLTLGLQNLEK